MRILVVEDEFVLALDLESMIRLLGHEIIGPVSTLRGAKAVAREADIAVVDVRLKDGLTGLEVCRYLDVLGVTVLLATGNSEAVPDDFPALAILPKPYDANQIADAIAFAIARREGHEPSPPAVLTILKPSSSSR